MCLGQKDVRDCGLSGVNLGRAAGPKHPTGNLDHDSRVGVVWALRIKALAGTDLLTDWLSAMNKLCDTGHVI